MIRTFAPFSCSVSPTSLVERAYLDLKESWVSYRTKKKHNILATYNNNKSLSKGPCPI